MFDAVSGMRIKLMGCDDCDRNNPLGTIEAEALAIHKETGEMPFIIVDYVQLLARGSDDKKNAVGELTMRLRIVARCGVGQYGLDVDAEQRRAIDAGQILAGVERQRPRRDTGDVGAEIAVAGKPHAKNFPSASSASSAWINCARPWLSDRKLVERSSVHFTGRPSAFAACRMQVYSDS